VLRFADSVYLGFYIQYWYLPIFDDGSVSLLQ